MTKSPQSEPSGRRPSALAYSLITLGVMVIGLLGYIGYALYPRFGLPAVEGVTLLLLAVAAGTGSFFSPCSFPLLVALLGRYSGGEPEQTPPSLPRALTFATALALGAAAFLLLSGVVLALGGEALFAGVTFTSITGRIIRFVVGTLFVALGFIQLGRLPVSLDIVGRLVTPLMKTQAKERRRRPIVAFAILGFAYPLAGFG